jgi:hypothetical protein
MESTMIPAILQHPNMRIEVGADSGITITGKQP